MPINLDQTGPAHLLSTDADGLILNGSPVISKAIHVSDIEPKTFLGETNKSLIWLDTGVPGITAFPLGGQANYILRTDGSGNVSWIPPSTLDVSRFRYIVDDIDVNLNPGTGKIRFWRDSADPLTYMSDSIGLVINASDKLGNVINGFLAALSNYGNPNRRGFIKIEKENNPNFLQIYEFRDITAHDTNSWFTFDVTAVNITTGNENFIHNDPVFVSFTVAGPQAQAQDLTPYVLITGTQTLTNKTLTSPIVSGLTLSDQSIVFEGLLPDEYETTLTVANPTADRTVTIPDATTTLVGTDVTQTLTNKTIIAPDLTDVDINLTHTNGQPTKTINVSSGLATAFNTRIGTTSNDQYSWITNLYYDGSAWLKDDITRGAWRLNKVVDTTDTGSQFALTYAPIGTNTVANRVLINGNGIVSITNFNSSTTTTTGSLVVTGGVGISENINTGGNITISGQYRGSGLQNTPVGSIQRSTGQFTTLSANQNFEVTINTASTSQTTGAAVITGGLGVGGAAYINGPVYLNDLDTITETELTGYSLVLQNNLAKFRVGPNYTAGAVDFVDIKTQPNNPIIVTASDNFTIENTKSAGNITLLTNNGSVLVTDNTEATTRSTGAMQITGGLGVGLNIHATDIFVYGQSGLSNTASQVVSIAATQTLTNKTLSAATLSNNILTGTLTANNTVGIAGQLLESTGTGVRWVNPVNLQGVVYVKASDQNVNPTGDITWPSSPDSSIGSSFGSMDNSGIFTFSVTGTYLVTLNYSVTDINGGSAYPVTDFWIKKNNSNAVRYNSILTNGSRRGSVSETIPFASGDTLIWFVNSVLRVNGGTLAGSRLTIIRLN